MHRLEKGTKMNSSRYLSVLQDKFLTHMMVHGTNIFMQDGAPCHKAKIVTKWLADSKIQTLDWPGNSPDLNPIENLWRILKQKVSFKKFNNFRELQNATIQAWATETIHSGLIKFSSLVNDQIHSQSISLLRELPKRFSIASISWCILSPCSSENFPRYFENWYYYA